LWDAPSLPAARVSGHHKLRVIAAVGIGREVCESRLLVARTHQQPRASAGRFLSRPLLFERLAVSWEIAGLPLESQKELLGRYRMATTDERRWVRETLTEHLAARHPDVTV